MIDIEPELFSDIKTAINEKFPDAYVTGEYTQTPPSFPCVSIVEADNDVYRNSQTSGEIENHGSLLYEVNVYSNKSVGKKSECRAIAKLIDTQFAENGFTRTLLRPIENTLDATIYRVIGRYTAVISKDKVIYRR